MAALGPPCSEVGPATLPVQQRVRDVQQALAAGWRLMPRATPRTNHLYGFPSLSLHQFLTCTRRVCSFYQAPFDKFRLCLAKYRKAQPRVEHASDFEQNLKVGHGSDNVRGAKHLCSLCAKAWTWLFT